MMKKTLLLGGLLFTAILSNAQRLSLYEEFSGENCAPCALANPGLMVKLNANPTKILLIKYQSPIPTAGPIYDQNPTEVNTKLSYYSINSAPSGVLDGGTPTHPNSLTQAQIDAASSVFTPFAMTVTNAITGTNITATVNITSSAAFTGGNMKLRVALVEDLEFATAPGTNGETTFHHVMRKMLADGTAVPNVWTASQSQSFTTTSIAIPSYVDRTHNVFVIAWVQDETGKKVWQSTASAPLPAASLDATIANAIPANGTILCGASTVNHTVKVKNTGTTPINKVQLYYKNGTGAMTALAAPTTFSPALAAGATSSDIIVNAALPVTGAAAIVDSIGFVNDLADQNLANNAATINVAALGTGGTLPQTSGFEGDNIPTGFLVIDKNGKAVGSPAFNGENWFTHTETAIVGQGGSAYTAIASCQNMDMGATTILTFPYTAAPTGAKAVDFYYSYAVRGTVNGDKLELVYSTNCGQSWTSLWSKSGSDLATAAATASTALFLPKTENDWRKASVDVSSADGSVLMGFRATSGTGALVYIDNVTYRTGTPLGIEELVSGGNISIYPNPVNDQLNVQMSMVKSANVTFSIVNVIGQQMGAPLAKKLNVGQNNTQISTSDLSAGIYILNIATEKGNLQQKFVKN